FQYFGLWVALSFVLHAYFGFRLCEAIVPDSPSSALLGGAFLLLSPAAAVRASGHFALTSHWLILAALWLYFRPTSVPTARRALAMLCLCLVASVVHPYFLLLCLVIVGATYWRMIREGAMSLRQAAAWAALTAVATEGSLATFGYFLG